MKTTTINLNPEKDRKIDFFGIEIERAEELAFFSKKLLLKSAENLKNSIGTEKFDQFFKETVFPSFAIQIKELKEIIEFCETPEELLFTAELYSEQRENLAKIFML